MNTITEIITIATTAFASGGFTWLVTLKSNKRQAEAQATQSVQDVYQELIDDLKKDRDFYSIENAALRTTIKELNERIEVLEKNSAQMAKSLKTLQPMLCTVHNCAKRCYEIEKKKK